MAENEIQSKLVHKRKLDAELYKHFFFNTYEMVCIANSEGFIEILNPSWTKILGYSEEELLGSSFVSFVHPEDIEDTYKEIEKLKSGAITINFINRYRKKDGNYLYLEWNSTPEPTTGKVYAIARDITNHINAEKEYLEAKNKVEKINVELIRVNQELEQFAYLAAHDLQEPLRTITKFADLVEQKLIDTPDHETKKYISFIRTSASKMTNLIKDLMEFSRVGQSHVFTSIDCNKILTDVLAQMSSSIKTSNAKITLNNLPTLIANETELSRLFLNLISNAIKFQNENTQPIISISGQYKDDEYIFSVKDNGIGIKKEFMNKLFNIFQRFNPEYPGNGIGLAICKKIVELHEGKIWIESIFGKGTTFYFSIPKLIQRDIKP